MYKLVDCVFEDVETRHQFVVPFIIIDAKKVHLTPNVHDINYYLGDNVTRGGKMSNLTDNRYGQVTEYIESENPKRYEYNIITNKNDPNDEKMITRNNALNQTFDTTTYVNHNKPITYFDKDETRKVKSISSIEPLATGGSSEDIMRVMFGDNRDENVNFIKDYKLISMRLYKSKGTFTATGEKLDIRMANNEGVPLNSLWYGQKGVIDSKGDKPDYFKNRVNKVVNY